jgi:predicted DsbA family dithiol-disulfide isomerase
VLSRRPPSPPPPGGCTQAEAFLRSDRGTAEVLREIQDNMQRRSVQGVPHFIFSTPQGLQYVGVGTCACRGAVGVRGTPGQDGRSRPA